MCDDILISAGGSVAVLTHSLPASTNQRRCDQKSCCDQKSFPRSVRHGFPCLVMHDSSAASPWSVTYPWLHSSMWYELELCWSCATKFGNNQENILLPIYSHLWLCDPCCSKRVCLHNYMLSLTWIETWILLQWNQLYCFSSVPLLRRISLSNSNFDCKETYQHVGTYSCSPKLSCCPSVNDICHLDYWIPVIKAHGRNWPFCVVHATYSIFIYTQIVSHITYLIGFIPELGTWSERAVLQHSWHRCRVSIYFWCESCLN